MPCRGSAPRGVPGPEGVCLLLGGVYPQGVPGEDPPGWLLLWAVRILLECILVLHYFDTRFDLTYISS